jgi:hypothetical protein
MSYPSINERGLGGWILDEMVSIESQPGQHKVKFVPHVAGLTAVGVSYLAAMGLAFIPHPLSKAASVAILAIPDVLIYAVAYSMFD